MKFLRYADLVKIGVINNRVTLSRWIATEGFPAGIMLGPNSRAWPEESVNAWLLNRPVGASCERKP